MTKVGIDHQEMIISPPPPIEGSSAEIQPESPKVQPPGSLKPTLKLWDKMDSGEAPCQPDLSSGTEPKPPESPKSPKIQTRTGFSALKKPKWAKTKTVVISTAKLHHTPNPDERRKRDKSRRQSAVSAQVVQEAMKRHRQDQSHVFHPSSNFVAYWTLASIIILCFIFITVPFFLCFDPEFPASYVVVDAIVDIFFLCDIAVNFRTGYLPNMDRPDLVITDPYKVAVEYAKTWFIPDVISGFPIATLTIISPESANSTGNLGNALKLLKLGRFLRLIKLAKVSAMSHKLDEFYLDMMVSMRGMIIVVRMIKLLMIGFFIVHYVACAWWLVGTAHPSNSWVESGGADHMNVWAQYLFSCYWVITTMTTVGYGDTSAMNDIERAFSIFAMILGGSFYGLLIAKITNIVAESENNQRIYAQRLDEIALFVHDKRLPAFLQRRVLHYYQKFLKKASTVDEAQIIRELSTGIREQVVAHLLDTVVARGPFFGQLGKQLIDIVPVMHMTILDYGQHLTRKGQPSEEMLCVVTGSAVVLDESDKSRQAGRGEPVFPLFQVYPGAIFGERCLLEIDKKYHMTVRALTNCDSYVIYADEFKACVKPEVVRNLRLRLIRSLAFRIRVRTYGISLFDGDEDRHTIEGLVRALPPDPNKRTWSRRNSLKGAAAVLSEPIPAVNESLREFMEPDASPPSLVNQITQVPSPKYNGPVKLEPMAPTSPGGRSVVHGQGSTIDAAQTRDFIASPLQRPVLANIAPRKGKSVKFMGDASEPAVPPPRDGGPAGGGGDGGGGGVAESSSFSAMAGEVHALSVVVEDLRRELDVERKERAVAEAQHAKRYDAIFELLGGKVVAPEPTPSEEAAVV